MRTFGLRRVLGLAGQEERCRQVSAEVAAVPWEVGHGTDLEQLGDVWTRFNSTANLKGKKCPPALAGLLVLQNTKIFSWLFCGPGRAVNSQQLGIDRLLLLACAILGEAGRGRVCY